MTKKPLHAFGVLSLVGAFACGSFAAVDSPQQQPPATDGGSGDAATAPDSAAADAAPPGCNVVIGDDFDDGLDGNWELFGTPPPVAAVPGEVRLIGSDPIQGGLIRWKAPIPAQRLIVEATFRVGQHPDGGTPGDTFAISWMPAQAAFKTAGKGHNAFVCEGGNAGSNVYVDTSDLDVRVGNLQSPDCAGGANTPIDALGTSSHVIAFDVAGNTVSGTYDGRAFAGVAAQTLDGSDVKLMVSAASGTARAEHALLKLKVTACR